jgi:alkanesulfonate monooxygenase SsuD/methylene tetrahydromethanopterin reductase-like flavin-dependent oxidoreductase (luciferase family)
MDSTTATAQTNRPLQVGLFITAMAGGMRDGALRWSDLRTMAERAETLGFDSFWVPDHLIFKNPGEKPHGPWECWSLLSALAATTSRMQIGSLVTCVGFRNPGLLAKMADTIDEISGGRLILGLGAGWHEPEYQAFGFPYDHRFERFEEAVQIIRTLLREGQIDHDGRFYTLRECELRPRGPRPEGPPILIGALATKKRMLGLIARYADLWNGWLVHARSHPDEVAPLNTALDEALAAAGRDPSCIGRTIGIMVDQRPERERTPLPASSATPLAGTPEEIAAAIRAIAAQGVSHVQIVPVIQGVAGVEAFAPVLELLDR